MKDLIEFEKEGEGLEGGGGPQLPILWRWIENYESFERALRNGSLDSGVRAGVEATHIVSIRASLSY